MDKEYYYFSGELEDFEDLEREVDRVEHLSNLFNPNEEKVLDICNEYLYNPLKFQTEDKK